jgi:hypothetical protein
VQAYRLESALEISAGTGGSAAVYCRCAELAFSIYDEDQQGMRELYVFDQSTGKTTPVTTDIQSYDSPTVWSPSARFLSMYQNISEGGKQLNQSYIVQFKEK